MVRLDSTRGTTGYGAEKSGDLRVGLNMKPLTFPGDQSGQQLAQAFSRVCVVLALVVVGELL